MRRAYKLQLVAEGTSSDVPAAPSPSSGSPTVPERAPPSLAARLALDAREREIEALRRLATRAELAEALGALIHALQRERGASSVYLASGGRRFTEVRRHMAADALAAEARVRARFEAQRAPEQGASARMLALMAWVLLGMDAMGELRTRIEQRTLTAHDAVAAFSAFIAGQIELIVHMADAVNVAGVSGLLVAFLHLVQGKEEAGQERALGGLLFASGQCTDAHQQRLIHLIEAQERNLAVFTQFVDVGLAGQWDVLQLAPNAARLERLRRMLATARPAAVLDAAHSDPWFEVSTERIDGLWALEVALVARLREACAERIEVAERELEDSEGMLRYLRDHPPAHTHAVERFFDLARQPAAVPEAVASASASPSLFELVHAQSSRLATMEGELMEARRALHERKVIERAKGRLMTRLGVGEVAAFRMLQKTSMDQNRRMVEVAEATLALPDDAFAQLARPEGGTPEGGPP